MKVDKKKRRRATEILTENATPKPSRRWITGHEINVAAAQIPSTTIRTIDRICWLARSFLRFMLLLLLAMLASIAITTISTCFFGLDGNF